MKSDSTSQERPPLTDRTKHYRQKVCGRVVVCDIAAAYGPGTRALRTTYVEAGDA